MSALKPKSLPVLTLFAAFLAFSVSAPAQSSYDLRSPDNRIEIRIRTAPVLRYDVLLSGRALLQDSTLSLDIDHNSLGVNPKVRSAKKRSYDQTVEPPVRQKFAKIREHYNELRLEMDGNYAVVFRAYNEGAAYRFETSLPQPQVKVYGEEVKLNFAADNITYFPQEDTMFSHNERKYLPQKLSQIASEFISTMPVVWDAGEGAKLAAAESDVEDYGVRGHGDRGSFAALRAWVFLARMALLVLGENILEGFRRLTGRCGLRGQRVGRCWIGHCWIGHAWIGHGRG